MPFKCLDGGSPKKVWATPGVIANAGSAVTSIAGFRGTIIDSVRDDGLPSGPCPQAAAPSPCYSFFNITGTANFDNRARTPRALGGVSIEIKLNQPKGQRIATGGDGVPTPYTWDLKPCGGKGA